MLIEQISYVQSFAILELGGSLSMYDELQSSMMVSSFSLNQARTFINITPKIPGTWAESLPISLVFAVELIAPGLSENVYTHGNCCNR
jgi:hypothetical protein